MPHLKVIEGSGTGHRYPLAEGRAVIGRHPSCQIVLDDSAVSRQHAEISCSGGHYFLADIQSRNGTEVNGSKIRGKVELVDGDIIALCDFRLEFSLQGNPTDVGRSTVSQKRPTLISPLVENMGRDSGELVEAQERLSGSSILSTLDSLDGSSIRVHVRPEVKLRAVLEISSALGRKLDVDSVLETVLKSLFKIFPQAESGFFLLKDSHTKRLSLRSSITRNSVDPDAVPVSMTIVKQAMELRQSILSADAQGDQRFDSSESLSMLGIRSVICSPLVSQDGEALGVIQLSTQDMTQHFQRDDLELLASVSSQATMAVENATLHEAALHQRDLERDLDFAKHVQQGFLPRSNPQIPGYVLSSYYEPAYRVGGDYYDYIKLPDGRMAVAIADVAGKGVPAALLMARLHASARYHLLSCNAPDKALVNLNEEVSSSAMGYRFITMALVVIDSVRHTLSIANAGHLPPILRRLNGEVTSVGMEESGMPLGIQHPTNQPREVVVSFEPGDQLLLYTDGITEAMSPEGEVFGRERLANLMGLALQSAPQVVEAVVETVKAFSGSQTQRDDLCVVAIARSPAS